MEEDMGLILEPMVDAISNLVTGDVYIDCANEEARASVTAVLNAVATMAGLARSLGAVAGGTLFQAFQKTCDAIDSGVAGANTAMDHLAKDSHNDDKYRAEFLPQLQKVVENVGYMLQAHAQMFVIRVQQHGDEAKRAIRDASVAVYARNAAVVMSNAQAAKASVVGLSKAAAEASQNTDNELRKKMIEEAQNDLKDVLPEFLNSAQGCMNATSGDAEATKKLQRSVRAAINAIDDVINCVNLSMRKVNTISKKTERAIMESTDDVADNVKAFMAAPTGESAKALVMDTARCVQVLQAASKESTDPQQAQVLAEQAEALRAKAQRAIVAAKTKDQDPQGFIAANHDVLHTLQQARHAVTGKEGWGLSSDTENRVLNATKETALADKAVTDDPSAANASRLDAAAVETVKALRQAQQESKDPNQQRQIAEAIAGIESSIPIVQKAAKAAKANPNDSHAQANIAKANDDLLQYLRDARRAVVGLEETPLEEGTRMRVIEETNRVARAGDKIEGDAASGNKQLVAADADELVKSAQTAARGLGVAGEQAQDPVQKVRLLQAGDSISAQANRLAQASAAAAANPSDKTAQDNMASAHDALQQTVKKAQAAANMQQVGDPLSEYQVAHLMGDINHVAQEAQAVQGAVRGGDSIEHVAQMVKGVHASGAKAISSVYEVAADSADPRQRAVMMEKADILNAKVQAFEASALSASKAPKDGAKQAELARATDELMHALNEVRHATGRDGDEDSHLSKATVDQILNTTDTHAKNIEDLRTTALNMNKKGEEVTAAMNKVKASTVDTCAAVETAISETKDPVQRAKLVHGKKKLQKDSEKLDEASAAVAADPTSQPKRRVVGEICEDALQTIREVRAAATGHEEGRLVSRPTEQNVLFSTADLLRAANRVEVAACTAGISKQEQAASLNHLDEATENANSAILSAAAEMPNADRRTKLMGLADKMKAQSKVLDSAGKKAMSQPGDAAAKAQLDKAKKDIVDTVEEVRKQVSGKTVSRETEDRVLGDTDEVAAAVQQCRRAVQKDAQPQAEVAAVARLRKAAGAADKSVERAIAETTDPDWKTALANARNKLKPATEKLAAATEAAGKNKGDPNGQKAVDAAAEEVMNVLREIRHATTGHKPNPSAPGGGASISDEAISRTLKATDKQATTGHKLAQAARAGNKADTDNLIKQLASNTEATLQAANGAASEAAESGAQRKRIIEASDRAAASAQSLQTAAKTAAANPSDHAAAAQLARALDNHDKNLRDVRKAVAGDEADSQNLSDDTQRHVKTSAMESRAAVHRIVKAAGPQGSPEELHVATRMLNDSTASTIEALYGAAAESTNIVQKQKLLAAAEKMQVQSAELAQAAAAAQKNPADARAQDELQRAKQAMLATLDEVDEVVATRTLEKDALSGLGLEEAAAVTESFLDRARKGQVGNNDLVAAAAEAAQQALQLCEMARSVAEGEPKPEKKKQILDAADKTERSAEELLNAMRDAAAHPNDVAAAKRLDASYTELNKNVQTMVGLCYSEAELVESGLADALKQMQSATQIKDDAITGQAQETNKADQFGKELLEFLNTKFLKSTPKHPREYVQWAKTAAEDAEKFLKELDAFIAKCDDPIYKEQLKKLRRTIKDRSIQLKILATTKANSNDVEEARAALQAATQNLTSSIQEAMSCMQAASLRNRFKKAVNTAVALSKAVKGFKGLLKKK